MRITYAAPANLASAEAHCVHIVNMCHALAQQGVEITAVVDDAPSGDEVFRQFAVQPFDLRRARSRGRRMASLRFAAHAVRATGRKDLLFTRNLVTALVSVLSGRKTILELHSPVETRRARRMLRWVVASPRTLALVVITHALRERMARDLAPAATRKILVLPDAAPEPLAQRRGAELGLQRPAVGYVGSFNPGKGVELAAELAGHIPGVHVYIVGGSPQEIELVRSKAPHTNLHFLGRIEYSEVARYVQALDVALLPNQRTVLVSGGTVDIGGWTSPLKLFEYMACGKAIVASRLPVLSEVLRDGEDCLMADPENLHEWIKQVDRLVTDRDLRARLGAAARSRFIAAYSWRKRAERVLRLISDLSTMPQ